MNLYYYMNYNNMNTRQFLMIMFRSTFPEVIIWEINNYCNRKLIKPKYKIYNINYKDRRDKLFIKRQFIKKYN